MKIKIFAPLLIVILIIGLYYFFNTSRKIESSSETKVHYHAGFVVFKDSKKVDYSDTKYMQIKPCLTEGQEERGTAEDEQIEKAHLHDNVSDVVHVEANNAKWGDLFANVKYDLDYSKTTAFVNGQKVKNIKNYPIKAYDSLILFIGDVDEKLLSQSVTKERIENVEKTGVTCGE